MKNQQDLLDAMAQLTDEVQRLHMEQTVQHSGYLLLARHLAVQGWVQPATLASDLETMGQTQPDAGWQAVHAALADALRLVCGPASTQKQAHGPRP